jgi:hypothetical protein
VAGCEIIPMLFESSDCFLGEFVMMKYLSIGNNAKTIKSDEAGEYLTAIMYMRPNLNICPMSELAQCAVACLNTAGRGKMNMIQEARQRKTDMFQADPIAFVDQLKKDVLFALRSATKKGVKLAVRFNGTSDIAWENIKGSNGNTVFQDFPDVQFYDYTKLPNRKVPSNYHLTVSYSGANAKYAAKVLKTEHNIAVVFRKKESIPAFWNGRRVVDGDRDDLRFLDEKNVIVALYAKGSAKKDTTGFVVDVAENTIAAMAA